MIKLQIYWILAILFVSQLSCSKPSALNIGNDSITGYKIDVGKFPLDTVSLPANLENLRPGQIRDAVLKNAVCLLPVGNLQPLNENAKIGLSAAMTDTLNSLARNLNAVIAPPIWYTPTGYLLNSAQNGTFDIQMDYFTDYLEEVLNGLSALGFSEIRVVVLNNPQGADSPLFACAKFAVANMYNNLWKNPQYGKNWYINPKFDGKSERSGKLNKKDEIFSKYQVVNIEPIVVDSNNNGQNIEENFCLEKMFSWQIKKAVDENLICFIPSGVIETHGNHNPVGVDAIEAEGPLLMAGLQANAVVAPTIWYGPTGITCGDETVGNINVDGTIYRNYVSGIISGLAAMGFRRIIVVQVHQGPNGPQWLSASYGIQQLKILAGRNKLKASLFSAEVISPPEGLYDHAGKNETSWMMFLRPENTNLSLITPNDYFYCWQKDAEANTASFEWGKTMALKTVEGYIKLIETHNEKNLNSKNKLNE